MKLPIFQIDAFTGRLFGGNPAAVCPLEAWLATEKMQAIAAENNLSETAFFVARADGDYDLRWFTPAIEVDLCGHATVAAAHVIFAEYAPEATRLRFHTQSGAVEVARDGDLLILDFPARPGMPVPPTPALAEALGRKPREVFAARDYLAVYDDEADIRALAPDMAKLAALDRLSVIATAPGDEADFISRFFAPGLGVDEDPVTGSAHCTLIPYWSRRLGKTALTARQLSARGGELVCEDRGERVRIGGRAVRYLAGHIEL